jgi:uncharacterized protein (DUF427 family)
MAEQESAYQRFPHYRVDLLAGDQPMQARFGTTVIAHSDHPLLVAETDHEAVVYFPLDDVVMTLFTATDHKTFCPFKGQASYWSLQVDGDVAENVMWAYQDPVAEVAGLKGYAAFYVDRVQISVAD